MNADHANAPLLDCRPLADYCAGHLPGAVSFPAEELFARLHELPPRTVALRLCGTASSLQQAGSFLSSRGYTLLEQQEWPLSSTAPAQSTAHLEYGHQPAQLWQATPLLKHCVEVILPTLGMQPGLGLELACGAGRDLVYLAQQGWQMTGVDWSADSLNRAAQLARTHAVDLQLLHRDLETASEPLADLATQRFQLVYIARYLHRPLFPLLRRLLQPGGVLIYQTFMQGAQHTAIGRPRQARFLLEAGELAAQFPDTEHLMDEVELLDDGRPVSAFIARSRSV